jgi:hypothetical protein
VGESLPFVDLQYLGVEKESCFGLVCLDMVVLGDRLMEGVPNFILYIIIILYSLIVWQSLFVTLLIINK